MKGVPCNSCHYEFVGKFMLSNGRWFRLYRCPDCGLEYRTWL